MSEHDHREYVEGCFRCDLSRAEAAPDPSSGGLTETERERLDYAYFATDCNFEDVVATVERIVAAARRDALLEAADRLDHVPNRHRLSAAGASILLRQWTALDPVTPTEAGEGT